MERSERIKVVVDLFVNQHLTYRQIAAKVGTSATSVGLDLKEAGISARQGTWVTAICTTCQKEFQLKRYKLKKSKRHFCSDECYYSARSTTDYKQHRQGQRHAREIVSQYFRLKPGYIVHHEDGNNDHNELDNLRVFESQSDHLKYHHGVTAVRPIWDGRQPYAHLERIQAA